MVIAVFVARRLRGQLKDFLLQFSHLFAVEFDRLVVDTAIDLGAERPEPLVKQDQNQSDTDYSKTINLLCIPMRNQQ